MSEAPMDSMAESSGTRGPTHTEFAPWYDLSMPYREVMPSPAQRDEDAPRTSDQLRVAAERAYCAGDLTSAMQLAAAAGAGYREVNDEWGTADALALCGAIARCARDWPTAVEYYREALSAFTIVDDLSSAARVYRSLAEAFFTAGDFDEAAAVLHEGLTVLPDDPVLLSGLGYSLWYAGHEADALAHLNRALAVDPDNRAALFARGQIHADLGRPRLALADLDRLRGCAIDEAHRRADLKSARGISLIALGRTADGEAELEDALLLVPHRARTQRRVAEARLREGDTERARIALHAAVTSPQPLPSAHADRARRLLRRMPSATV
ncbi:hypothetical protein GCM10023086_44280 [Streptomyces venetus]|uniref:Tetratricopeptide repeat protein n=1 Tax=Streptomyces venetus TaxID=1701086 RepID=A0ABP8G9Q1_9ACTN